MGIGDDFGPALLGVPLHRFREAYERTLPRAMELAPDELTWVNVDVPEAVVTVRGAIAELQRHRPQAAQLPFVEMALNDELETYALALTQAHAHWLAQAKPERPARVLTASLKATRLQLVSDARATVQRGILHPSLLDSLRSPNGAKNTAMAVLVLCAALRSSWPHLHTQTAPSLQ